MTTLANKNSPSSSTPTTPRRHHRPPARRSCQIRHRQRQTHLRRLEPRPFQMESRPPHAIIPVQQFAYTKGKNATDMALVIDAMDLLYSGNFDGFCIVSSDSDFTRLASRLRESGLTVYGFGERNARSLPQSLRQIHLHRNLPPRKQRQEKEKNNGKTTPPPPLTHCPCSNAPYAKTPTTSAGQNLGPIGSYISKINPDFDSGCTATANSPTSSNPSTSSNTAPTTTNSKSAAANPPTSRQRGRLKTRWQRIKQKKPFQTTPTPRKTQNARQENQPSQKRTRPIKPDGRHRAADTRQTRTRRKSSKLPVTRVIPPYSRPSIPTPTNKAGPA